MTRLSSGRPVRQRVRALRQVLAAVALGSVLGIAWNAAAARLEAAVPGLTDGQLAVRLAQMVAMLHDDETLVEFPPGPVFGFDARQVGEGLYLLAVPLGDKALVGARLLAMDGHPIAQVMASAGTTIGAEDAQLQKDRETGALNDAGLLHSLGVTASAASTLSIRNFTLNA